VTGYHSQGAAAYLNVLQQRARAAKVELGEFRTVWEAVQWVEDRWNIHYRYPEMYALLKRHELHLKVPRPRSDKADPPHQEDWKKGD
jgi:transposase